MIIHKKDMDQAKVYQIALLQSQFLPFQDFIAQMEEILGIPFSFAVLNNDLWDSFRTPHFIEEIDKNDISAKSQLLRYLSTRLNEIDEPIISAGLPHVAVKLPHVVGWAKIRDHVLGVITYQIKHTDLSPDELDLIKLATKSISQSYFINLYMLPESTKGGMLTQLLEGKLTYFHSSIAPFSLPSANMLLVKLWHADAKKGSRNTFPYIRMLCTNAFKPIDICKHQDGYYMLLHAGNNRKTESMLASFCKEHSLCCTISETLETYDAVQQAYAIMKKTIPGAKNPSLCRLADYALDQLLIHTKLSSEQLNLLICDEYRQIQQYDRANQTDFLNTVLLYIQHDCNAVKTAKAQFIHANTVAYRIRRIEDTLHINLNDQNLHQRLMISAQIDEFIYLAV